MSDFSVQELAMTPLSDTAWGEEELETEQPIDPELLARRRRFRSWVTRGMVCLALFTMIGV
jgi:hypothetical protein